MGPELAYAFSAGMIATINPCGFALLPAYLAYFLGLEDADPTDGPARAPVLRALKVSAAVTAGFLVVFAIMGFAWSSISGLVATRLPYFTIVVGIFLIGLGIAMLRGFEPTLRLPKVEMGSDSRELTSMFLYGISYAVASLSCTIPIYVGIVATTLERTSFASGVATFVAYGLGMGMTLAILTIAVALAKQGVVTSFRRILPHVNTISAVLLIVAGAFVGYYGWVEIQELNAGSSSRIVGAARGFQSDLQNWVERVGGGRLALGAAVIIAASVAITLVVRRTAEPPDGRTDDGQTGDGQAGDGPAGDAAESSAQGASRSSRH